MILALRTDSPEAKIYLLTGEGTEIATDIWRADRQLAHDLLAHLEKLLIDHGKSWEDLTGLIVYRGPGSFTGLRIGITVMNTIAYAQTVPIIGAQGEQWLEKSLQQLRSGQNDTVILPEYGADARITKPRK